MGPASRRVPTRVAALLLPRWPLPVLAHHQPALLTHPTAVVTAGRVVAVSRPAEAAGIRPGLTLAEARARCPHLTTVAEAPAATAAVLAALWPLLEAMSPTVEQARPAVFFLDWSGLARQPTGELQLAQHLAERVATGLALTAQVGIADGPFTAALAASQRATPGQPAHVPPATAAAFLAPFDLALLPGIRRLVPQLYALGLRTMGDLVKLPRAELVQRFGAPLALAHQLASGQDARPLRPRQPLAERTLTHPFDPPETALDRLLFAALRRVRTLWDELEQTGQTATLLRLILTLTDDTALTLSLPLLGGAGIGRVTLEALQGRLDSTALPGPVVSLTLTLAGIGPAGGRQVALLEADRAARRPRQLEAVARLSAFTDDLPVLRLAVQPALVPEAAVIAQPWSAEPPIAPRVTRPGHVAARDLAPHPPGALVLPAVPGLRRIVPPRSVQVLLTAGRPAAFADGLSWWPLVAIDGPARAVSAWWTTGQPRIDRDYYLVATATGQLWVLIEDRTRGDWQLIGEID